MPIFPKPIDLAANYVWTGDHTFDGVVTCNGDFNAVDGEFSGTVTTEYVSSDDSVFPNPVKIRLDGNKGYLYGFNSTVALDWTHAAVKVHQPLSAVISDTVSCGTDAIRWSNVYSVDGSFSGNLTSEVGGSYKLYNLGDSSAADSEYYGVSIDSGVVKVGSKSTGAGVLRNLYHYSGGVYRLYASGELVWGTSGSTSMQHYRNQLPAVNDYRALGSSTLRWSGVYGVDGSFSGNLTSEVGGSIRQYSLGTEGDTDTEYIELSNNGTNFELYTKATGAGTAGNIAVGTSDTNFVINPSGQLLLRSSGAYKMDILGNGVRIWDDIYPLTTNTSDVGTSSSRFANVYSVNGSFTGNLTSEVGGSIRVYGLGVEGDTDTEFLQVDNNGVAYRLNTASTGSGTNRRLELQIGGSRRFTMDAVSCYFYGSTGGYIYYGGNKLRPQSGQSVDIGSDTNRFENYYGVDGDFSGNITAENLPTSDPGVPGQFYVTTGGALKVSQ